MTDQLWVYYEQRLVGRITRGESRAMRFSYEDGWRASSEGFPISLALPLNGTYSDLAAHHFFANLLPEGDVRDQICRSLKVSPDSDFDLLRAIGGDCAGALSIQEVDSEVPADPEAQLQKVSDEQLANWSAGTGTAFLNVEGAEHVRLSLAGAQNKLPVHVMGDQLFVPLGSTPSTHILKFASPHYRYLPENEVFINLLGKNVELPTVEMQLHRTRKASLVLIARYDRAWNSGRWHRLHQEDFCQALGIDASRKYEKEGGPSLRQCVEILRQHSQFPLLDLRKLLRWTLFNLLIGNADAHGKNLSLLYRNGATPELAPFYDLICTRHYRTLSREMAMGIGGAWDSDFLTSKHLQQLADDFGFHLRIIRDQLKELSERIPDGLPSVVDEFQQRFGAASVLTPLASTVRKQVRAVRSRAGL